jgi:hypothetical protein
VGRQDVALILVQNLAMANLRSNMGKAGREKFEKEFTLEVFEKRMTWNTLSIRCSLKWGLRETDIGRYIQYDI